MTFHDSYIIKKNVYKKLYIQNKLIEMSVINVFSTKSLHVQLLLWCHLGIEEPLKLPTSLFFRYCKKMCL